MGNNIFNNNKFLKMAILHDCKPKGTAIVVGKNGNGIEIDIQALINNMNK